MKNQKYPVQVHWIVHVMLLSGKLKLQLVIATLKVEEEKMLRAKQINPKLAIYFSKYFTNLDVSRF